MIIGRHGFQRTSLASGEIRNKTFCEISYVNERLERSGRFIFKVIFNIKAAFSYSESFETIEKTEKMEKKK